MADTTAIVNLMRHAAERLAEEDIPEIAAAISGTERRERAGSAAIAAAYAEAILRTVAAALDESEVTP
jgi:hypothetical protein